MVFYCEVFHWLPGTGVRGTTGGIHGYFLGDDGSVQCLDFGGMHELYIC